jgi:hypothetical protein
MQHLWVKTTAIVKKNYIIFNDSSEVQVIKCKIIIFLPFYHLYLAFIVRGVVVWLNILILAMITPVVIAQCRLLQSWVKHAALITNSSHRSDILA